MHNFHQSHNLVSMWNLALFDIAMTARAPLLIRCYLCVFFCLFLG